LRSDRAISSSLSGRIGAEQHPDPARLIAAEQADRGPRRIVAIPAKDHPYVTSRTNLRPDVTVVKADRRSHLHNRVVVAVAD
jgi:hypothetical protein